MHTSEEILEHLPCGCMVFDNEGVIRYANPSLCSTLECRYEDIINNPLETILSISSSIFYQTHFFPLLKLQGQVCEIFLTLKSRTGNRIPVMINAKQNKQEGDYRYVASIATVWERQKYERELLEASKAQKKALEDNALLIHLKKELEDQQRKLDRNLAVVIERNAEYLQIGKVLTHDMQEPIRKIALCFESLLNKNDLGNNTKNQHLISIINKSTSRLHTLTNALTDFVKFGSRDQTPEIIRTATLLAELREEFEQLNGEVLPIASNEVPDFWGIRQQIKRVFYEIIKNSIQDKSTSQPLQISIHGVTIEENTYKVSNQKYDYSEHIRIEITDNGKGFESQYEEYVFGLLNKLTDQDNRLGIGLTLCKQIVQQHRGTVTVRSKPNQGTTTILVIPLNRPKEMQQGVIYTQQCE